MESVRDRVNLEFIDHSQIQQIIKKTIQDKFQRYCGLVQCV